MNKPWTIIKLEGYCFHGCDLTGKMSKVLYDLDGNETPNEDYDPSYVDPPAPDWCPGKPCYMCLFEKCVHFGYCEYTGEEDD